MLEHLFMALCVVALFVSSAWLIKQAVKIYDDMQNDDWPFH